LAHLLTHAAPHSNPALLALHRVVPALLVVLLDAEVLPIGEGHAQVAAVLEEVLAVQEVTRCGGLIKGSQVKRTVYGGTITALQK
jgi:hypothetical protein